MGAIKETKLANGNVGLEITYGGKEAPFGGVDSSAPPAYIDPRCFTECDGFIVVDNKLVAVSLNPVSVPVLWSGTTGVQMIGFGNFYNPTYGTLNYALGYTAVAVAGTPTGVTYTFYMTSWAPASIATVYNDVLTTTQFNSVTPAVAASITMQLQAINTSTPGSGATVTIDAIGNVQPPTYPSGVIDTVGVSSGPGQLGGGFCIPGVLEALTITGGINYVVGTTYLVVQGSNVTGQIEVTSVDPSTGAITGFTIVSDSFTTTYVGSSNSASSIGVAGWGYSLGSATLEYAQSSNVVLDIYGVTATEQYVVESNGTTNVVPTLAGANAVFEVTWVAKNGTVYLSNGLAQANCAVVALLPVESDSQSPYAGSGYNIGEVYQLVTAVSNNGNNPYTPAPVNYMDPGVWLLITAIGVGGTFETGKLIGTGLETSTLVTDPHTPFTWITTGPGVGIVTLTGATAGILDQMAAEINGTWTAPYNIQNADVTATVDITASSLTLTAIQTGVIGNSISVQDFSTIAGPDLTYYYFPVRSRTYLTGGGDGTASSTVLSTVLPTQASIAAVGGILYIANIGPFIIKYEKPGIFVMSSTYQGVQVLKKFAGSLIGLGLIPSPNTIVAAAPMIIAWSATNDLDVWNPLDLNGNVTGAGFAQIADIGDYLSGLIVTGGTAFILRSQGISYATATGNATNPFSFAHLGLGDGGEGSQINQLTCQYDQMGAFVGNSNIYQVSSSITPFGAKIKHVLYQAVLDNSYRLYGSVACAAYIEDEIPVIIFALGNYLYVFNASNETWTTLTINTTFNAQSYLSAGVLASENTSLAFELYNQSRAVVVIGQPNVYQFYALYDGATDTNIISATPTVSFPVEEVSFGRDITIDALYVSVVAAITADLTVLFLINNVVFSTLVLTPDMMNTGSDIPVEFQLFPDSGIPFTGHSPQLSMQLPTILALSAAEYYAVKVVMFGSYDPNQRPV